MSDKVAALLSNDFIYAAMALYTLSFLTHAVAVSYTHLTLPTILLV